MAIKDFFKKKEQKKKPGKLDSSLKKNGFEIKKEKKERPEKPAAVKDKTRPSPKTKISETAYQVLRNPHVTEKAGDLLKNNQYVFKIFPKANKIETKKAIENYYGVEVVSVKIINLPEKKRRIGKIQGARPAYKKAIVKIKEGQKIEVLSK